MYSESLLEENNSLNRKITKAMTELKDWFNEKIEKVKEFFYEIKSKFNMNKKKLGDDNTPISRDVKVDGDIIFRKGTPCNKVWSKVFQTLNELKSETEATIRECKIGIKNVISRKMEMASKNKTTTITHLKRITLLGTIIVSGVGAVIFCKNRKKDTSTYSSKYSKTNTNKEDDIEDIVDIKQIGTTKDTMKLLPPVIDSRDEKVDEVKNIVKEKIIKNKKEKAKKEIKDTIDSKIKSNKKSRSSRKNVLKNNPLRDINMDEDHDEESIKIKIKGLYTSIKRAETQYNKLETQYKNKVKDIKEEYPSDEAEILIDKLRSNIKARQDSYADKIEVCYKEIDKLKQTLSNKEND